MVVRVVGARVLRRFVITFTIDHTTFSEGSWGSLTLDSWWSCLSWDSALSHSCLLGCTLWLWLLDKDTFSLQHISNRWVFNCCSFNTVDDSVVVHTFNDATSSVTIKVTYVSSESHYNFFLVTDRSTTDTTIIFHVFKTIFSLSD